MQGIKLITISGKILIIIVFTPAGNLNFLHMQVCEKTNDHLE
jgi:hypothetical protein